MPRESSFAEDRQGSRIGLVQQRRQVVDVTAAVAVGLF